MLIGARPASFGFTASGVEIRNGGRAAAYHAGVPRGGGALDYLFALPEATDVGTRIYAVVPKARIVKSAFQNGPRRAILQLQALEIEWRMEIFMKRNRQASSAARASAIQAVLGSPAIE